MTERLPIVEIVSIVPTKIWIECGIFGERYVVAQHEGYPPFDYAVFNYDYTYTSNAGTLAAATKLAIEIGATEPVEMRSRPIPESWLSATPPGKGD